MNIVLVPIGAVDPAELRMLVNPLRAVFSRDVVIGEGVPLPKAARNDPRSQHDAEIVLESLALSVEMERHDRVLGVTNADLYLPGMNFVFGIARERWAIISLHRLRESFYGLPDDPDLFRRRAVVEAVHELGHTFGLAHCKRSRCVMFFSNTVAETDRKGPEFCMRCRLHLASEGLGGRALAWGGGPVES